LKNRNDINNIEWFSAREAWWHFTGATDVRAWRRYFVSWI